MNILGIESSCDETGIGIYNSDRHKVFHAVHSQIKLHARYGGVVPELASREHIHKITPLLKIVLQKSHLTLKDIDGIAYTAGPGLIGALLVGASFARSLAWSLNIPAIGIHHLEGHLLSPLLEDPPPIFPFVALLVSGGHTLLVHVKNFAQYEIIGDTLDDAVGEAFDKTGKLLGLKYPAGAALAKLAEKGDPDKFSFTRPMINRPGLDFSFSGLKTQVLNIYQHYLNKNINKNLKADIAASFQKTVIEALVIKCKRALDQTNLNQLVVAGGVSANDLLQHSLKDLLQKLNGRVYFPCAELTSDNGAMIAFAGYYRFKAGLSDSSDNSVTNLTRNLTIQAKARWELDQI